MSAPIVMWAVDVWKDIPKPISYFIYLIAAYFVAQLAEFLLNKFVRKYRLDKWFLFLLFVKAPYVKTKVSLRAKQRPQIEELQKIVEKSFEEGLDRNEKPRGSSYIFKLKNHATVFKMAIVEPNKEDFIVILETFGEDRLSKFSLGSLEKTVQVMEALTNNLKKFELEKITVTLKILQTFEEKNNLVYQFKGTVLSPSSISIGTNEFSRISSLVKECLQEWRVTFL